MLLLVISFIGGVLTVLAPCILPLLPVIVGGSISDGRVNKKKALTVVLSLGVSVMAFTLLLKASTLFIAIPEYTWKIISGGIILLLGLVTIFPSLWEGKMMAKLSSKSNMLLGKGDRKKSFFGDVIIGAALGPVFSTCSPTYFIVLATVLPVNPALGMVYLLAYAIGLCLSLLVVAYIGQKIMHRLNIAADPHGIFKKVLGLVFVLVGIAILTGVDKKIESKILDSGYFDVTKIEQILLDNNSGQETVATSSTLYLSMLQKQARYKKAPELSSIDGYINTDGKPITLAELKGKVVLLDIWTYSCINCQRTLPYLNDWYSKYKDQGLEIIGLHTPEFAFEKVRGNVEKAVKGFNIKYPVVLDNDYSTWQALGNQFWPRKYLIDADGYIIYDHIGEGAYDETEAAIQKALKERASLMGMKIEVPSGMSEPKDAISVDSAKVESPEIYFGSARNRYLGNGRAGLAGEQVFSLPSALFPNTLYLDGKWNISPEYAESKGAASVVFEYQAKNVYMAAGSLAGVEVEIYKDDVFLKKIMIKDETLYPLIEDSEYGNHVLRIKVPSSGLKAFTFTFG